MRIFSCQKDTLKHRGVRVPLFSWFPHFWKFFLCQNFSFFILFSAYFCQFYPIHAVFPCFSAVASHTLTNNVLSILSSQKLPPKGGFVQKFAQNLTGFLKKVPFSLKMAVFGTGSTISEFLPPISKKKKKKSLIPCFLAMHTNSITVFYPLPQSASQTSYSLLVCHICRL